MEGKVGGRVAGWRRREGRKQKKEKTEVEEKEEGEEEKEEEKSYYRKVIRYNKMKLC